MGGLGAMQTESCETDKEIKILLVDGGLCRVDYGDAAGGRYVIARYDDIKDYVTSKRPRSGLLELFPSLAGK